MFVRDTSLLRITSFVLDAYTREYQDSVREHEAHAIEMDSLRIINRNIVTQVSVGFDFFNYFQAINICTVLGAVEYRTL